MSDVVLANDNSPAQVVISGTPTAVQELIANIKTKRAMPLKVSGAFHSPFMAAAASEFQQVLETITFNTATIPVLSNVEPVPTVDAAILKDRLTHQMTGGVRWRETVQRFVEAGVQQVVEIGSGNVLTGLIKRTCPDISLENISGKETLV